MKFGTVPTGRAEGAILAHSTAGLKKGRRLAAADIAALEARGVASVIAVFLDNGDVAEDIAAAKIARAIAGQNVEEQRAFAGRANLYAAKSGVLLVDEPLLRKLNGLHEALTVATLKSHEVVRQGRILATVKIIPYAAPERALNKFLALLKSTKLIEVAAFTPQRIGLVITKTPEMKSSLIAKSQASIAERARRLGSVVEEVVICVHDKNAVAAAIKHLAQQQLSPILVFGASAIVDRADIVPAALKSAKGRVLHLGMPVDPGNLLMLGCLGDTPVIGVPTCARSLKVNGFDWVLSRICANLEVAGQDIANMGAGGLLAEIDSRPQRRDAGYD